MAAEVLEVTEREYSPATMYEDLRDQHIFCSNMITVTCAIIEKNGWVLCAQRGELMHLPLKWEFPGAESFHLAEKKTILLAYGGVGYSFLHLLYLGQFGSAEMLFRESGINVNLPGKGSLNTDDLMREPSEIRTGHHQPV